MPEEFLEVGATDKVVPEEVVATPEAPVEEVKPAEEVEVVHEDAEGNIIPVDVA